MKRITGIILIMFALLSAGIYAAEENPESLLMKDDKAAEKALIAERVQKSESYEGKFEKTSGQVLIKYAKEEIWKQAATGMAVKEGSIVITTEKAKAKIVMPNGTIVELKEKTQAIFATLKQNPDKKEMTETGIKLVVGKIFSNVKKLVDTGSKYEIKTESATAGVRGTQFMTGADENGNTDLTVYEGTVGFATPANPDGVPVEKGEKVTADKDGKISEKSKHEEQPPVDEEEIVKAPEEEKKEEPKVEGEVDKTDKKDKKEKESKGSNQDGQGGSRIKGTLEAGAESVDGISYATLQFKPDFERIFGTPIGVGLKVTLLQGSQPGKEEPVIKYGPDAGDKWWEAITVRWLEWKGETIEARYGEIGPTTYGHGLLMENFDVFGLRAKYKNKNFNVGVLTSLKETPLFAFDQKIAARGELKLSALPWIFSNIWMGATYVTDLDDKLTEMKNEDSDKALIANAGVAGDLFIPISGMFTPYAEYAQLIDYGAGAGAGVRGNIGFFGYKAEYRVIGEEFRAGYYDDYYITGKDRVVSMVQSGISTTDGSINIAGMGLEGTEAYSGWLGQATLGFGDMLSAKLVYEDYGDIKDNGDGKRITIGGRVKVPQPKVEAGLEYKQRNIDFDNFKWFDTEDENWKAKTSIAAYLVYPVAPALGLRIDYSKNLGESPVTGFRTIFMF